MIAKTHKLTINESFDFNLIGISSHENDYRLSWIINQSLDFKLNRVENLSIVNHRLNTEQQFSVYHYFDEDTLLDYHLIANRCDDGFLLAELKNLDFLLKISGDTDVEVVNELADQIKKIGIVTTAFRIYPAELKSKEKLIF